MSTPLEIEAACENGNIDIIKNANKNIKWNRRNHNDESYIDIAIKHNQYKIVSELLKLGAKYNPPIGMPSINVELAKILEEFKISLGEVTHDERKKVHDMSYKLMQDCRTTL